MPAKDEAALQRSAGLSLFNRVGAPAEMTEVVAFLTSGLGRAGAQG